MVRVLHCIHEIELSRMAVLTPYKAQKEEIRKLAVQAKLLSEDHSTGLNVASITESQGKLPNCKSTIVCKRQNDIAAYILGSQCY